ncbi:MAG: GIY-YIG nuclease family protein [Phycisphaerae bacterium]
MGWFVYILECTDNSLYTGLTCNLLRRWEEHLRGGSRYTKGLPPRRVIHVEVFPSRSDAAKREHQLKGWTRRKKLALATGNTDLRKRL